MLRDAPNECYCDLLCTVKTENKVVNNRSRQTFPAIPRSALSMVVSWRMYLFKVVELFSSSNHTVA